MNKRKGAGAGQRKCGVCGEPGHYAQSCENVDGRTRAAYLRLDQAGRLAWQKKHLGGDDSSTKAESKSKENGGGRKMSAEHKRKFAEGRAKYFAERRAAKAAREHGSADMATPPPSNTSAVDLSSPSVDLASANFSQTVKDVDMGGFLFRATLRKFEGGRSEFSLQRIDKSGRSAPVTLKRKDVEELVKSCGDLVKVCQLAAQQLAVRQASNVTPIKATPSAPAAGPPAAPSAPESDPSIPTISEGDFPEVERPVHPEA